MHNLMSRLTGLLLAGCAFVSPAYAAYDQTDDEEPPSMAARLSIADGDAQIWRTDEDNNGAWDEAQINDVVTVGTGLYTGAESRAEVRWGPHALRLGDNSRGGFSRIDYDQAVFNLEYGSANVRLREDGNDTFAATVAGMHVELQSPGRYRIDAREGQPVRITAFEGRASLQAAANSLSISAGQALDVGPGGSSFAYANVTTSALDEWSRRRDEHMQDVRSAHYVSPYMTGYEDLDANGDWATDPTYGAVWYPRAVAVGWVPYRYGRWRWIAPWGWTWVDDAPWGFAPFHYGRWVVVGGRWCWWPGQRVVRPVYAPALVAWVGNPGWSVSVTVGGPAYVGWYPLAPWNAYEPIYTRHPGYRTRINQVVMHVPPRGASNDRNLHDGRTIVPGRGFREPIRREYQRNPPPLPSRDLRPVTAPPPRTGFAPTPRDERGPVVRPPAHTQPAPQNPPRRGTPEPDVRVPTPRVERGPVMNDGPRQPTPAPNHPQPQPSKRDMVPTPRVERSPTVIVEPPRAPVVAPAPAPVAPTPTPVKRVAPQPQPTPQAPRPQPQPEERQPRVSLPFERGPVIQQPAPQPAPAVRAPAPRMDPVGGRQSAGREAERPQPQRQHERAEPQAKRGGNERDTVMR